MKEKLKHNDNLILWGLVFILGIITCIPLLNYNVSNVDDFAYRIMARSVFEGVSLKALLHDMFLYQGRFTQLLTGWSFLLAFFSRSRFLLLLIAVGPIIADFSLIILLAKRWTGSEKIALATALFTFSTFALTTKFNASTGYPFTFSFSFMLLLISLIWLIRYLDKQQYKWLMLSAIMMFLASLFYESYLLYYIIIYLMLRSQYLPAKFVDRKHWRKFGKELLPFVVFGFIFLISYLTISHFYGGNYSGVKFSVTPLKALRTWGNLILYSLPGMSYFQHRIFLADYSTDPQYVHTLGYVLTHAGAMAWCKGLIVVLLFAGILKHWTFQSSSRKLWYALCIAVLSFILPHLLISCSEKYITLIPDSYVSSFFASFGMTMTWLVLYLIIRHYLGKKPTLLTVFNILTACGLLFSTILTQLTNEQIMEDIRRANLRYDLVDDFLEKTGIDIYKKGTPTLVGSYQTAETFSGKGIFSEGDRNYFLAHGNGNFLLSYKDLYDKYHYQEDTVAILAYRQAAKSDDIYFLYYKCKGTDLPEDFSRLVCDQITAGYYSAYKTFSLSIGAQADSTTVIINDKTLRAQGRTHYANIRFLSKPEMQIFTLSGSKLMPVTLMLSNILYPGIEPLDFGHMRHNYYKDCTRFFQHEIWRNQPLTEQLRKEAEKQGIDAEKFIKSNAQWLATYHDEY